MSDTESNSPAAGRRTPPTCCAVRFRKQVHGCFAAVSSSDVFLERTIELPIPPSVGMSVSIGDWEDTITALHVHLDRGTVEAWTEEDKELYDPRHPFSNDPNARPIEEIVAEYLAVGWERSGHNDKGMLTPTDTKEP